LEALNLFIHFSMDPNDLKHSRYLRNTVGPLLSQPSLSDGNQRQSSKRKSAEHAAALFFNEENDVYFAPPPCPCPQYFFIIILFH
jgi:hypothetical protein